MLGKLTELCLLQSVGQPWGEVRVQMEKWEVQMRSTSKGRRDSSEKKKLAFINSTRWKGREGSNATPFQRKAWALL